MKLWIGLTIVNVALVATPLFVANPLITQTPGLLSFAHNSKSIALAMSLGLSIALGIRLWRRRAWSAAALLVLAIGCALISRVHYLEWIFAAARGAETVGIGGFHDIRDTDMVIAVSLGGESRAYPVRYLAYHHMLNDQLGATALLPTY